MRAFLPILLACACSPHPATPTAAPERPQPIVAVGPEISEATELAPVADVDVVSRFESMSCDDLCEEIAPRRRSEKLYSDRMCSTTFSSQVAGAIDGKAGHPSGGSIGGLTVVLSGHALDTPRSTETDRDGAFTFRDVPPGSYTLTFSERASNRALYVERCVVVEPGATASVAVTLTPRRPDEPCVGPAFGLAILELTVVEDGGAPMPGVKIRARTNERCPFIRVEMTDRSGELHLYAIEEGTYTIYVSSKYFDQRATVTATAGVNALTIRFPEGTSEAEALIDERKAECNCLGRPDRRRED